MKTYEYRKIDAFTSQNSLGNPAACIYLKMDEILTENEMLDIAKQHKGFVSEVIFCTPKSGDTFGLIYFSSECEVNFCGHGTIACMYNLIIENEDLMNKKEIFIVTNSKGTLTVFNEIKDQNAVYISAPNPKYIGTRLEICEIADNLSINKNQISITHPIDLIDAGLRTLIVPIKNINDEINIFPNEQKLKTFCLNNEVDIILIYTLEASNSNNIAHTRVFAPKFGYLEDPATGSGNSAYGYYMLKNNIWNGKPITIEQGGIDRIYNTINLRYMDNRLLFGGKATTRIKGVYFI